MKKTTFGETAVYLDVEMIEEMFNEIVDTYEAIREKEFTVSLRMDYSRVLNSLTDADRAYELAMEAIGNDSLSIIKRQLKDALLLMQAAKVNVLKELGV